MSVFETLKPQEELTIFEKWLINIEKEIQIIKAILLQIRDILVQIRDK